MEKELIKSAEDYIPLLDRIKNIIAVDNGCSDWNQLVRVDPETALGKINQVSLLYTLSRLSSLEAFKSESIEVIKNLNISVAGLMKENSKLKEYSNTVKCLSMEAENQKLREALEGLVTANKKYKYTNGVELYDAYLLAVSALKHK